MNRKRCYSVTGWPSSFSIFLRIEGVKKWPYHRKFSTLYNIVTLFNICHKISYSSSVLLWCSMILFHLTKKILFCSSSCSCMLRGKDIQYHSKVFDARSIYDANNATCTFIKIKHSWLFSCNASFYTCSFLQNAMWLI